MTFHRPELAWIGTETNEFGTDEFLHWCEVVGTDPFLCLNFGTGTLDEGKELCSLGNKAAWLTRM